MGDRCVYRLFPMELYVGDDGSYRCCSEDWAKLLGRRWHLPGVFPLWKRAPDQMGPRPSASSGLQAGALDPARSVESLLPIAAAHIVHPDFGARLGRVDKLAVADVNPNMAERPAHGVEENQVAGAKFSALDGLGNGGLLVGAARQKKARRLLEHGPHEPAAIEAAVGAASSAAVRNTKETHGIEDQFRRFFAGCCGLFADALPNLTELTTELSQQPPLSDELSHLIGRSMSGNCPRPVRKQQDAQR